MLRNEKKITVPLNKSPVLLYYQYFLVPLFEEDMIQLEQTWRRMTKTAEGREGLYYQ